MEETPINKPAATSVDENAKPFQDVPPPDAFVPDRHVKAKFITEEDNPYVEDKEPDSQYQPVAHRLEDLISETNYQLDKIQKIVQVLQILLSLCAAAAIIYIAAKVKGKGTPIVTGN